METYFRLGFVNSLCLSMGCERE